LYKRRDCRLEEQQCTSAILSHLVLTACTIATSRQLNKATVCAKKCRRAQYCSCPTSYTNNDSSHNYALEKALMTLRGKDFVDQVSTRQEYIETSNCVSQCLSAGKARHHSGGKSDCSGSNKVVYVGTQGCAVDSPRDCISQTCVIGHHWKINIVGLKESRPRQAADGNKEQVPDFANAIVTLRKLSSSRISTNGSCSSLPNLEKISLWG